MCLIECVGGDFIFFNDITKISIENRSEQNWVFALSTSTNKMRLFSKSFKTRELALDWLQEIYDHRSDSEIYTLH